MEQHKTSDWMQTHSGRRVYPLELEPDMICLADIAASLAKQCRFSGHCRQFYSVAEHSIRMTQVFPQNAPLQRWALMHDAAEAYLSDVTRPIKRRVHVVVRDAVRTFSDVEHEILDMIATRYGLQQPMPKAEIEYGDMVMLATERRDLLHSTEDSWCCDGHEPLPQKIEPRGPEVAEADFLAMARVLGITD